MICCLSDSTERPAANTIMNNYQEIKELEDMEIRKPVGTIQTTAVLKSAIILKLGNLNRLVTTHSPGKTYLITLI